MVQLCFHRFSTLNSFNWTWLNCEKTCNESTSARSVSVPMKTAASDGCAIGRPSPKKAEFTSVSIFVVSPMSLATISPALSREGSSDFNSCINSV